MPDPDQPTGPTPDTPGPTPDAAEPDAGQDLSTDGDAAAAAAEAEPPFIRELRSTPRRARRTTARRRGRVISEGGIVDDPDQPQTATVRSEAHEGEDTADPAPTEDATVPGVLDATGQVIGAPVDAGVGPASTAPGQQAPAQPAGAAATDPAAPGGRMVDPGVFVVVAARAYLEGLDAHGADHPVTQDRLDALRRTLDVYAGDV